MELLVFIVVVETTALGVIGIRAWRRYRAAHPSAPAPAPAPAPVAAAAAGKTLRSVHKRKHGK